MLLLVTSYLIKHILFNFILSSLSGEVQARLCLERSANYLHMVQLMPLPPHHLLLH